MKREDFLERVRAATGRNPKAPVTGPPEPPKASSPQSLETLAERFKLENERVLGKVYIVRSLSEARDALVKTLEGAKSYIRSPHGILDQVGLPQLTSNLTLEKASLADVGVTGCEYAIAATGSIALSSGWGRLAALLPYRHVVVLRAAQIVPDVEDWYSKMAELARSGNLPGAWGMHTGPSKSADIEQTMALGVHGPGKVDVIVILE
jgi:L-lactate dehydrogenase complex protein LldG